MSDRPFRLTKVLGAATFQWDGASAWNIYPFPASSAGVGNNWQVISGNTFLCQETIDLAGFTREELTLFFANQRLQRAGPYLSDITVDPVLGGVEIRDVTIASDVPLSNPLVPSATGFPNAMNAGFPNSTNDYTSVKFAEGSIFVQTSSAPLTMTRGDAWDFASADPTAADKLYLYRYLIINADPAVLLGPPASSAVGVPDLRYIATGVGGEEPGLQRINRLRLSYEQQQRQ